MGILLCSRYSWALQQPKIKISKIPTQQFKISSKDFPCHYLAFQGNFVKRRCTHTAHLYTISLTMFEPLKGMLFDSTLKLLSIFSYISSCFGIRIVLLSCFYRALQYSVNKSSPHNSPCFHYLISYLEGLSTPI